MSDNGDNGEGSGTGTGMPQGDVDFLIACLQNATGGSISIDTQKVAEAKGYKNHRSVQNRISALKKKYELPFGTSSPKKASDAAGPNQPAIPKTPSKQRVTKNKNGRTPLPSAKVSGTDPRATAKGKGKKGTKKEVSDDEETGHDDDAVKSPKYVSDDGLVFGRPDTDEKASEEGF